MSTIGSVAAQLLNAPSTAPQTPHEASLPAGRQEEPQTDAAASKSKRHDSVRVSSEAHAAADQEDAGTETPAASTAATASANGADGEPLTDAEQQQVDELRTRDREVRSHEQAHAAAGGAYAIGGPTYQYQQGPDGRRYAVGGEVSIDTSAVDGDPAATIRKMDVVRRAALAPAQPSSQDRAVAAEARSRSQQARIELQQQQQVERTKSDQATDESASEAATPANAAPAAAAAGGSAPEATTDAIGAVIDLVV